MEGNSVHSSATKQKFLIIIAGPTAVGKTKAAIQIAKHFQTEIISADSRQVFKELNIGVARPSVQELSEVQHHCIAHKSIHEYYSAGQYEREVIQNLAELFIKQDIVVMCGGTGLYINAVCEGFDEIPEVEEHIRYTLNRRLEEEGLSSLQAQLKELDMATYTSMDIQNTQRVIRALEVCIGTGKSFSSFKENRKAQRNFIAIKICLDKDREELYNNIHLRVDQMIQTGLVEEARSVSEFKHINALQTVGYKELSDYFEGQLTLEEAIDKIKQHTRNYAKRQLTWFRKDKSFVWFRPEQIPEIIRYVDDLIK